jgi:hypothetical protein
MAVLSVRNVLPVVTSVVATLFLATAVPHDLLSEPAFAIAAPETPAGRALTARDDVPSRRASRR